MMDEKRIRETINQAVKRYLLGNDVSDSLFDYSWICAQLTFAYTIYAITYDECDTLRKVVTYAYRNDRRGPECVDFPRLS